MNLGGSLWFAKTAYQVGGISIANLVIHPRVAPVGHLRVWLGVFDADTQPASVTWKLDGVAVNANPARALTAAHAHGSRTFTGVFDLAIQNHTKVHQIEANVAGAGSVELAARSPVEVIPDVASGEWLRILLTSCYHQAEDRAGQAGLSFETIPPAEQPNLTLLMGDQVYLDLPTLRNFPDDEAKLAAKFESDYRKNWESGEGLGKILSATPSVACPDDHEYWNNFPHRSPIIENSWTHSAQGNWKRAADQTFDAFQLAWPAERGDVVEIDYDELSVLVLDQRSHRRDDRTATLTQDGLASLEIWVDRLIRDQKFGAVVTGQSLLDKPVGEIAGRVADRMLANYGDYEAVVRALVRLAKAGRPVLLLTGDVHWGRVTEIRQGERTRFYEIVCSPSALVSTVGSDQLKTIGAGIRAFFGGTPKRWPRHSEASDPEPYFASQVFGKTYTTHVLHKQQGDQLAMLALRKAAGVLEVKVTYREVHKSPRQPREILLGLLRDRA